MTSPRRPKEQAVIDNFAEQLAKIGLRVSIDSEVVDKPDMGFKLHSQKIGCELTTLTLQEYEHWQLKKAEENKLQRFRLPNSPEEWAKNSILTKSSKIRSYNPDRQFSEIWLLLHVGNLPAFGNDKETINWLRWAASSSKHDFSQIWFLGEKNNLVRLHKKGQARSKKPNGKKYDHIEHRSISTKLGPGVTTIDLGDSAPLDKGGSLSSQLLRGAFYGDIARVQNCIERGTDINHQDDGGNTALRYAAGQGHANVVKLLLKYGADKSLRYENKISLIELCTRREHYEVVNLLEGEA